MRELWTNDDLQAEDSGGVQDSDGVGLLLERRPIQRSQHKVLVRKFRSKAVFEEPITSVRDSELAYTSRIVARRSSARVYTAYGAARKLWSCRDEEILVEGPAGTGKTRAILEKMHFCAMKYPGFRGLIIRKTRESLTNSVLVTLEEKVIPADSLILAGPKRRLRATYHYPNGSEIDVGGMDKSSKIMSTEYDAIGCFESTELTEEDFENLTTRLRNGIMPYQQIIADCNPGGPSHWLNKRPNVKGTTRLLSRHEDNPVLYDQLRARWTIPGTKYLNKLDHLTGARRLRLRFGKWAAAEGMVFQSWDPDLHLIEHSLPPRSWRRIRVVDFGYTNPFVCQWWALDYDGRMFMYREIYFSKRLVEDHAKIIKSLSKNEEIEATVCDWDAEDRATLERYGIPTIPAYKDITPGIQGVESRLRKAGDGKVRIFYMRDALVEQDAELEEAGLPTMTVEEFDNYVYPKLQDGKVVKEIPVDKDNHGMDATRYAVSYFDDLASMVLQTQAEEAAIVYA